MYVRDETHNGGGVSGSPTARRRRARDGDPARSWLHASLHTLRSRISAQKTERIQIAERPREGGTMRSTDHAIASRSGHGRHGACTRPKRADARWAPYRGIADARERQADSQTQPARSMMMGEEAQSTPHPSTPPHAPPAANPYPRPPNPNPQARPPPTTLHLSA